MACDPGSQPPARLIDLTRLLSRVGRGPHTGVDRVELAYLDRLLSEDTPVFALMRASPLDVLLDRRGIEGFRRRITGEEGWGRKDAWALLLRRQRAELGRACADMRRLAVAKCLSRRLPGMLSRHLPPGTVYLNTGHSNLKPRILDAVRAIPQSRITVFIHDTIPVDHPEFTAAGQPERFARMLDLVAQRADLVIFNSDHSKRTAAQHFERSGRVPPSVVAHLAVPVPRPDPALVPPGLPPRRPYFVTLGTIEPRKNHSLLLDIWQELHETLPADQVPHLLIIGARGWANADVFKRLDRAPFMGQTVFELADMPDGAVAALLAGARGLLFPSHTEGFGLPLLEAAALGVPAICNDLSIYREFAGDYPIYAPAADRYLWRQNIMALAAEAAGAGQVRHVQLPTWEEHFRTVLKLT